MARPCKQIQYITSNPTSEKGIIAVVEKIVDGKRYKKMFSWSPRRRSHLEALNLAEKFLGRPLTPGADPTEESPERISAKAVEENYRISGGGGLAVVHMKRRDGTWFAVRVITNSKTNRSMVSFRPEWLTIPERRKYVAELRLSNKTQLEMADILGVSPATINNDITHLRRYNSDMALVKNDDNDHSETNKECDSGSIDLHKEYQEQFA